MKPQKIKPIWECLKHRGSIHTDPGSCPKCDRALVKIIPLPKKHPVVFRCKKCRGQFLEQPEKQKGHRWYCPQCDTPTVAAWVVSARYLDRLKDEKKLGVEPQKKKLFLFTRSVRKVFQVSDGVSRAAFRAEQLAQRLSERQPREGDDQGFIDGVDFDIARFNMRAQMIVEIVLVKSLMEEAGLEEFISAAVHRILDARLGPRITRLSEARLPTESAKE